MGKVNLLRCCQAMIEHSGEEYWLRDSATHLLAGSNFEEAVPLLVTALRDKIPGIAAKAKAGLERFASKGNVTASLALAQSKHLGIQPETTVDFLKLEKLVSGAKDELRSASAQTRRSATRKVAALAMVDDGAIPILLEQIKHETDEASLANMLRALANAKNSVVVPILVQYLNDNREAVRLATVDALGRLGTEDALQSLLPKLRDSSAQVVGQAMLALRNSDLLTHPDCGDWRGCALGRPVSLPGRRVQAG